jgi:hypothetical protein
MTPCSPLKTNRNQPICLLPALTSVSRLSSSSNLQMEAICSSETSVGFHWTVQRYMTRQYPSFPLWFQLHFSFRAPNPAVLVVTSMLSKAECDYFPHVVAKSTRTNVARWPVSLLDLTGEVREALWGLR